MEESRGKNYEFDFDLGGPFKKSTGALKDQKLRMEQSSPPVVTSNNKAQVSPSVPGRPWSMTSPQRISSPLSSSYSSSGLSHSSTSTPWIPVSQPSAKNDAFANLWNNAAGMSYSQSSLPSSSAPPKADRQSYSPSTTSPSVQSPYSKPLPHGTGFAPQSFSGVVNGNDPFANLIWGPKMPLAALKSKYGSPSSGQVSQPSDNGSGSFRMNSMSDSLPTGSSGSIASTPSPTQSTTSKSQLQHDPLAASLDNSFATQWGNSKPQSKSGGLSNHFSDILGAQSTSPVDDSFDDFQSANPIPHISGIDTEVVDAFSDFQTAPSDKVAIGTIPVLNEELLTAGYTHANDGTDSIGDFNLLGGDIPSESSEARPSLPSFLDPFDDVFGSAASVKKSTSTVPLDPLEALFVNSTNRANSTASQPVPTALDTSVHDEWGVTWEAAGSGGPTTQEIEGLPPAPPGVTAKTASQRGIDFYKGGQFGDAIKWLIWAEQLCEDSSGGRLLQEVLSVRASCYKEVGEMKKAAADYTKGLELEPLDTILLMQRAILYESMEKYKLGVADLREVTRLDPSNRTAIAMLVRMNKALASY